jgi:hypothetical protein
MRTTLALIALATLVLSIETPVTRTQAVAATARCVAFCDNWCEKNRPRRTGGCSDMCQQKHCH